MPHEQIPEAVRRLAAELTKSRPMRRGSVSERSMKCGRKECRCQHDPQARHGPYFSLTRAKGGKTRSRYLSAEQVALAREQIEAGQDFRRRVEAYWQACEQWGDSQLLDAEHASQKASKKGASKRHLQSRSSPKSKRS